jgi:uncharacterized protein (DUF983 family)
VPDKSKIMGAGFRGRCPNCLEGPLFDGYLKFAGECLTCGESFDIEDAGDGPAVFVIMIASFLVVPPALVFQMVLEPPVWLTLLIWIPLIIIVCLALLRPFRGLMFALQVMNKAEQGQLEDNDT